MCTQTNTLPEMCCVYHFKYIRIYKIKTHFQIPNKMYAYYLILSSPSSQRPFLATDLANAIQPNIYGNDCSLCIYGFKYGKILGKAYIGFDMHTDNTTGQTYKSTNIYAWRVRKRDREREMDRGRHTHP